MLARINNVPSAEEDIVFGSPVGTSDAVKVFPAGPAPLSSPVTMITPNLPIVASALSVKFLGYPGECATSCVETVYLTIGDGRSRTQLGCSVAPNQSDRCSSNARVLIPAGSEISFRTDNFFGGPPTFDALIGWRATALRRRGSH